MGDRIKFPVNYRFMKPDHQHKMKHVCKLCSRRFPCGRSLGGHVRSHMIAKSKQPRMVKASSTPIPSSARKSGFQANGESGYGLRKNPKKTWRAGNNMTHLSSAATSVSISNSYEDRLWADAKLSALSSVSDTKQDIEVALGLMMLSRDYGYWGGTKFAAGSSDTNSLILEGKSSSIDDEDRRSDSGCFMKCADDDGSEMRSFC